jgi:hypothetical protein
MSFNDELIFNLIIHIINNNRIIKQSLSFSQWCEAGAARYSINFSGEAGARTK